MVAKTGILTIITESSGFPSHDGGFPTAHKSGGLSRSVLSGRLIRPEPSVIEWAFWSILEKWLESLPVFRNNGVVETS
jgi:hypothetical protein